MWNPYTPILVMPFYFQFIFMFIKSLIQLDNFHVQTIIDLLSLIKIELGGETSILLL